MTYNDLRKSVQARRAEDEDRATMLQVAADLDYIAMIQGIDLDNNAGETTDNAMEDTTEDTTETETDTENTAEEG